MQLLKISKQKKKDLYESIWGDLQHVLLSERQNIKRTFCTIFYKRQERNKALRNLLFPPQKKKHKKDKSENNEIGNLPFPTKRNQEAPWRNGWLQGWDTEDTR